MSWLHTIIFSIIEAVTEFLPVSSTAHLLLAEKLFPVSDHAFFADFTVIIQLAAIVAVIILFWRPVAANIKTWPKLLLAVVPTAVIGLLLKDVTDAYLSDASIWTGVMLIIFGGFFTYLDWRWTKDKKPASITDQELTTTWVKEVQAAPWYKMFAIGLGQSLALIPGVSRSGASIYTARALGFSKVAATALSFIVGVAVIGGAAGLTTVKNIPVLTNPQVIIALVITFAVSMLIIKPLLRLLATKPFWSFGLWRLAVGIIWLFLFWPH